MKRLLSAAALLALAGSAFAAVDPNVVAAITPVTPATPVPEADTIALALAGVGVVVALVRRAKKKK